MVSQDIKYNSVNRGLFFIGYDDFNVNRPENRLIKSTLGLLLKQTGDSRNKQNIIRLLGFFEGVDFSDDYKVDFSKCITDRTMSHYNKIISWCKVFLFGNSFSAFEGGNVALSLLFPMEKIFESFIAAKFSEHIKKKMILLTQDTEYSLFDKPKRTFVLRPDIVLKSGECTVIVDTKWKMLSDNTSNYGVSQSDMYQMYTYGKKYGAKRVLLLYPKNESLGSGGLSYSSDDNVKVL